MPVLSEMLISSVIHSGVWGTVVFIITQIVSYSTAILQLVALVLVILACLKYLRSSKKEENR